MSLLSTRRTGVPSLFGLFRNHPLLLAFYLFAFGLLAVATSAGVADASLSAPIPTQPYTYAAVNSTTGYDIMLADGVNKDRRIARIKVDSVFFADIDARLSMDGAYSAFRVTGDRLGGSSLYNVNTKTGKYVQIAASKTTSEGMGRYAWSPAGNTLAYVRAAPALDPALMDGAYGNIYLFSVGFQAVKLKSSQGNDRLLGFSSDGLGIYATRREIRDNVTLEHLVYLPLSGEPATVLLRSQPALRYSRYALWSQPQGFPKVAYLAEGDFSLAAANSNVREVIPSMVPNIHIESKVPTRDKLTRPAGMGLMTSDTMGVNVVLLRRDAEDYTHLSWTPDGSAILAGGVRSGASWRVDLDGNRVALGTSLLGLGVSSYSQDGSQVVLSDHPTTRLVTLNNSTGKVTATKYVGVAAKPGAAQLQLRVPYIHQVNDTADNVDGNWACGPTSIAMSLAYYGKIEPWQRNEANNNIVAMGAPATPQATAKPVGTDFAPYVTTPYTYNGHTYSAQARDPRGHLVSGLYGTICPTGFASWPTMISVLQWHGLSSQWVSTTWDGIVAALKRGHPVLLGNQLTSEGHILLVVGYTADGNLIVNDPYGNKFAPGYGSNNGYGVLYPWKRTTARRALEVIGVYPPPSPTPTITLTPTATNTTIATATAILAATSTATPLLAPPQPQP
ncbi:MAG: C39 family peptidase [Chloroflexota bacterium]